MKRNQNRPLIQNEVVLQPTQTLSLPQQIFNRAVERHQAGQGEPAEILYRAVLVLQPDHAQAAYNLGLALHAQRRLAEAIASYRHAISIRPDYAEAYCNLGAALQDERHFDEALASYRQAIAFRPDFAMAHCNLGVCLKEVGRLEEAVASYHHAIALQPDYDFAFANLAAVLLDQGKPAEASIACQRALAVRPDMAMAHYNLATAMKYLGQLDKAEACFRNAIALAPDLVQAHFSLAQTLLLQGNMKAGWSEYEWRWRLKEYAWLSNIHGTFSQPRWTGEPLNGRTILVYAEQGLGDAIQYVRYISNLAAAAEKVILAVHPQLRKLFSDMPGVMLVNLDTVPLPRFDVHCPLLSLPLIFGTTLENIPSTIPYLQVSSDAVLLWRSRIHGSKPRVGVVWAGNPEQSGDRFRSPRLRAILPLFDVTGISFVALQVGPGRDDLANHSLPSNVEDLGPEITDLADTAAIVAGLDLVITSCTAPLHLAGALGVPTWAIISASPHFAWLAGRNDSVWYPSLRLYRQETFGTDWSGVVARIAADLRCFAARNSDAYAGGVDESYTVPRIA